LTAGAATAGRLAGLLLCLALLQGCAGLYFRDAGPPQSVPRHSLETLPWNEYWTGVVFNGEKIGFTHLRVERHPEYADAWIVNARAALRFRFLGYDKSVTLVARDVVNADLSIREFHYDYDLDGSRLRLLGTAESGELAVAIESAADVREQRFPIDAPVYPTSVINLYPVLRGLDIGARYRFQVYDGESQRLAVVQQDVLGYERSELFAGNGFKVRTRLHGAAVTSWFNERGEPLLEISMSGIFIAGLEDEQRARRYLAEAALNKSETLLDFSLVRTDVPIGEPRRVSLLEIAFDGLEELGELPADRRQQCRRTGSGTLCTVTSRPDAAIEPAMEDAGRHLLPTLAAPAGHPVIRELATEITRGIGETRAQLRALLDWMQVNIEPAPADVFSALDVLQQRKAECQGFSYLFTALARSLGAPTRIVNGLVHSGEFPGFLYHTWVEALVDGEWLSIDPTFGQLEADATHVKLVAGESLADLAPLLGVIGRVSARILRAEHD
jgi:transglutaminase-like putative cysteine protease